MLQTTGIQEIVLDVETIDRMVRFYHDVIGLEIKYPRNLRSYAREQTVTFDACGCLLTLRLCPGASQNKSDGRPHLVFGVRNIAAARLYLQERAVELGEIYGVGEGVEFCDGVDPEGNAFSLVARQPAVVIPV